MYLHRCTRTTLQDLVVGYSSTNFAFNEFVRCSHESNMLQQNFHWQANGWVLSQNLLTVSNWRRKHLTHEGTFWGILGPCSPICDKCRTWQYMQYWGLGSSLTSKANPCSLAGKQQVVLFPVSSRKSLLTTNFVQKRRWKHTNLQTKFAHLSWCVFSVQNIPLFLFPTIPNCRHNAAMHFSLPLTWLCFAWHTYPEMHYKFVKLGNLYSQGSEKLIPVFLNDNILHKRGQLLKVMSCRSPPCPEKKIEMEWSHIKQEITDRLIAEAHVHRVGPSSQGVINTVIQSFSALALSANQCFRTVVVRCAS